MINGKENIDFLIQAIYSFIQNSHVSIKDETFTDIVIEINICKSILNELKTLYKKFEIINSSVNIFKNENKNTITLDEINDYIRDDYTDFKCKIIFNKLQWFKYNKYNITTFFDTDNFNNYLKNLNIFSQDNEFIKYNEIQIILPMYDSLLIESSNFLISNKIISNHIFSKNNILLPDDKQVRKQVQVLSNEMIVFSPKSFYIKESDASDSYIKILQQNYAQALISTTVNIFYSKNKIKIQGLKYLELSLYDNYTFSIDNIKLLEDLILWLYENNANVNVKLQLLADRLSIYKTDENNLLQLLDNNIKNIFNEIQDRYKFVIKEKSIAYSKDLKDILRDTEAKLDKFSQKTRLIINSLLRDILGSIFFIGLTVYSKFSTNKDFIMSNDANVIFAILSIYFILSMLFQSIFNFKDIKMTMDEMELGSQSSQEYMNKDTYENYVSKPLYKRKKQFNIVQGFIIIVYISLIFATYSSQNIYRHFIESSQAKTTTSPTPPHLSKN